MTRSGILAIKSTQKTCLSENGVEWNSMFPRVREDGSAEVPDVDRPAPSFGRFDRDTADFTCTASVECTGGVAGVGSAKDPGR